jgi:S-adenosyl-L-methionine hydrolase (adenosine-forming)
MIVLFTDFGLPYTAQMHAALRRAEWQGDIVSLFEDAPSFDARASAYLLAAYVNDFPFNATFVCVVDPGVGGDRVPVSIKAGSQWFVGPDNGLFEIILRQRKDCTPWRITWRPEALSASFHGRDLFSPVAAMLANNIDPATLAEPFKPTRLEAWPDDLAEVIYIDGFGNAMTGIRAGNLAGSTEIEVGGKRLSSAQTFSKNAIGQAFWYENANGLVEISVNQGRADHEFGLKVGNSLIIHTK